MSRSSHLRKAQEQMCWQMMPLTLPLPIGHHSCLYQSIAGTPERFPEVLFFNNAVISLFQCILQPSITFIWRHHEPHQPNTCLKVQQQQQRPRFVNRQRTKLNQSSAWKMSPVEPLYREWQQQITDETFRQRWVEFLISGKELRFKS